MRSWKMLVLASMMAGFPAYAGFAARKTWTFEGRCCTKALAGMIGSSRLGCPGPTHTP